MRLSSDLAPDFSNQARARGANYYATGSVRIVNGSESEVEARVQGARDYYVDLTCAEDSVSLWCDCPYFDTTGPCKHLWATILAAEAKGYLADVSKLDRASVIYDYSDDEVEEEKEDSAGFEVVMPSSQYNPAPIMPIAKPQPKPPGWREHLKEVANTVAPEREHWPAERELIYMLDVSASAGRGLIVKLMTREPKMAGGWKMPQTPRLTRTTLAALPDPRDRHILGLLTGATTHFDYPGFVSYDPINPTYRILHPLAQTLMPLIAATGRLMLPLDLHGREYVPLAWDDGDPWRFQLRLHREENGRSIITGSLRRGEEEMDIGVPVLLTSGGLVITGERVARLDEDAAFNWITLLRRQGRLEAPEEETEELVAAVLEHPLGVELDLPQELRLEEVQVTPRPCLTVRAATRESYKQERLRADLWFDYEGRHVPEWRKGRGVYDATARKYLLRDIQAEQAARDLMQRAGVLGPFQEWNEAEPSWRIVAKRLPAVVHACLLAGWHIEAEGKVFRKPGEMRVSVASGVDWFELHGEVDYGGTSAKLPALLAALRRGENMVLLDDGSYGLLPEEWLSRFGSLAGLGDAGGKDHIRFQRNQVGLLDALLAAQPEISCDETFERARDALRNFEGIRTPEQPAGFIGQLRDYQREGVGWMEFLRAFGFGGCLADDMGVGKTAQVLALLEDRRVLRAAQNGDGDHVGPSLVVVPKSLVFNWKQEAARFTPNLRVPITPD